MAKLNENSREIHLRPRRQLTLPRDICEQLDLKIGDSLSVTVEGDSLVARPVGNAALEALREIRQLFQESELTEEDLQKAGREARERLSPTRHGRKT